MSKLLRLLQLGLLLCCCISLPSFSSDVIDTDSFEDLVLHFHRIAQKLKAEFSHSRPDLDTDLVTYNFMNDFTQSFDLYLSKNKDPINLNQLKVLIEIPFTLKDIPVKGIAFTDKLNIFYKKVSDVAWDIYKQKPNKLGFLQTFFPFQIFPHENCHDYLAANILDPLLPELIRRGELKASDLVSLTNQNQGYLKMNRERSGGFTYLSLLHDALDIPDLSYQDDLPDWVQQDSVYSLLETSSERLSHVPEVEELRRKELIQSLLDMTGDEYIRRRNIYYNYSANLLSEQKKQIVDLIVSLHQDGMALSMTPTQAESLRNYFILDHRLDYVDMTIKEGGDLNRRIHEFKLIPFKEEGISTVVLRQLRKFSSYCKSRFTPTD